MRKQGTTARRFPFQSVTKFCAVDADQQQAVLAYKMLPSGFDDLMALEK